MVASGCIEAVVAAMGALANNAEMQVAACSALAAICKASGGPEKAYAAGCINAVAAAMMAHPRSAELQKNALTFLIAVLGSPREGAHLEDLFGHDYSTQTYQDIVVLLRAAPVRAAGLAFPKPHEVGKLATLLLNLQAYNVGQIWA